MRANSLALRLILSASILTGLPETLTRPVRVSSDTGPQISSDWA